MDEWSFAKTLSQCCSLFSRVGRSKESSDLCKKGTGRHIMLLSKDLKKNLCPSNIPLQWVTKWFKAKHPLKGLKNYRAVTGDVLLLFSWLRLIFSFLCDWRKTFYKENCFVFSVKSWSSIPLSWLFFQVITAVDALEINFKIVFDC